ncbi:hypothetical protein ACNKFW_01635 [Paracoccus sp. TD-10]|uniref:hypothetical protein n=1 Tax=Paracoccus sp. TD-10 TaxID=3395918 RepID=UPI003AAF7A7E
MAEQRRQGPNPRSGRTILPFGARTRRPAAPPRAGRCWIGCFDTSRCEPVAAPRSHRLGAASDAAWRTAAGREQIRKGDTEPEATMLAEHIPVQVRRSGTMVPVQSLRVGDMLFDPLSGDHVEILDIFCNCSPDMPGLLFGIAQGRLGSGRSSHGVAVSLHWQVPVPGMPDGDENPACLDRPTAARLDIRLPEDATLFAIFPERDCFMMSCGFCLRVLAPYPSPLH